MQDESDTRFIYLYDMLLIVESLSKIPRRTQAASEKVEEYVDLPLYVLGLQPNPDETGLLLVTDFTPVNPRGGVRIWKKDFDLPETGVLDESFVYPIQCSPDVFIVLEGILGKQSEKIHKKGMFLKLKFKSIHTPRDSFGILEHLEAIRTIENVTSFGESPEFQKVYAKFQKFASEEVKDNVMKSIKELVKQRESKKRKVDAISQSNFFRSSKGPTGNALAFQQQPETQVYDESRSCPSEDRVSGKSSQAQGVQTSNISEVIEIDDEEPTVNGSEVANQTQAIIANSRSSLLSDSQPDPKVVFEDDFDNFLINRVTIQSLKALPVTMEDIQKKTTFEIAGYLRMQLPVDDFIIKPYQRTLKISTFKIFLLENVKSTNSEYIELEFHSEEEKCQFLGLKEVEEALASYASLIDSLTKITNLTTRKPITITRKVTPSENRICYWTCNNTINDFL